MSAQASSLMLTYVHPLDQSNAAFKNFNEPIFISPLFRALTLGAQSLNA